jgi:hypothetical protein
MAWLGGDEYWTAAQQYMSSESSCPKEDPSDKGWVICKPGTHEFKVKPGKGSTHLDVRMLNCHKDQIVPPSKFFLFVSKDGKKWNLHQIKDSPVWANTNHDAFVDYIRFENLPSDAKHFKLTFTVEKKASIDLP